MNLQGVRSEAYVFPSWVYEPGLLGSILPSALATLLFHSPLATFLLGGH